MSSVHRQTIHFPQSTLRRLEGRLNHLLMDYEVPSFRQHHCALNLLYHDHCPLILYLSDASRVTKPKVIVIERSKGRGRPRKVISKVFHIYTTKCTMAHGWPSQAQTMED